MALRDAEDTFLGHHLGAVGAGHRLALVGRQLIGALRRGGPAGTQSADDMRHPPDAILVGDQQIIVLPGKAIGPVQILDMAIDPLGVALAVITQQGQVARALLGNQHIAVGQHQEAARVDQTSGEGGRGKPRRHLQGLAVERHVSDRLVTIGPVFGGGNSEGSMR